MAAAISSRDFCRGNDFLQTGPRVSSRQVVAVLGRWRSYQQWDSIGVAKALDAVDLATVKPMSQMVGGRRWLTEEEKAQMSPARTPMRRDFCKRNGLVQRWIHDENVRLLPFKSKALAASVGATPRELNAEPISTLATDVVFDALSVSQSGIVSKTECDARRASYETEDGSFDEEAFAADLNRARGNVIFAYACYPGLLYALQAFVFYKIDGIHKVLDWADRFFGTLATQWQ